MQGAFENGYKVIVPKNTTTIYDNEFFKGKDLVRYFEEKIWSLWLSSTVRNLENVDRLGNVDTSWDI